MALAIVLSLSVTACANVPQQDFPTTVTKVSAFNDVNAAVTALNKRYGADQVLIVSDIDNTLLTSTSDLGGDIWYQWQREKLAIKPTEDEKVACLFEDTIGLLYELAPMQLTEQNVPALIRNWQQQGNTMVALTSRAPKYRAATERELERRGIDFTPSALAPLGASAPVFKEMRKREVSYMEGILMTSGLNKGEMLNGILDKMQRKFKAIVFVDDSQHNIDNMFDAFKNRNDVDMQIFHYDKVEADREAKYGSVLTQQQADKMASDWKMLSNTLNRIFPARALNSSCLSVN
ncbi:DUF2608 domain-containing protein [Alteromonas pelagimontana]|uniref:DUF2608 domain-containing protein n=2 Tax=Alteromonas pelagimontana TaxID=1858656 RepID=A0A6M4ML26_9ALTE|nr:DUF2608 domain-containing protein [Alteromonas pelagimontana]